MQKSGSSQNHSQLEAELRQCQEILAQTRADSSRQLEALRESEAKFRKIVETTHEGIWIIDAENNTTYMNARMAEMLGVDPEKAIGLSMFDFMDNAEQQMASANVQSRKKGVAEDHEFYLKGADGRHFWTLMSTSPLVGEGGAYEGALAMVTDISALKSAAAQREELLRKFEAEKTWLNAVIENSPLGIFLVEALNPDRVRLNQTASVLLGLPDREEIPIAELAVHVFWANGNPIEPEETLRRTAAGEMLKAVDFYIRRSDGTEVPILAYINPVIGADGRFIGVMGVLEDITKLKEQERLRQEWISMVAHDLRQPITAILGGAEIMALQLEKEGAPTQPATQLIVQSARQVNRMVDDLLDASNIESRHLVLQKGRTNIAQLVTAVVSRAESEMKGHAVEVTLAPDLPHVEADAGRLEQVLGNLLSNAAKYGYPNSKIEVGVSKMQDALLFVVSNEGEGIQAGEIATVFERFHRSPGKQQMRVKGIGLGLYISKGLVEAHGGRVWAESEPGKRTTFCFSIPMG